MSESAISGDEMTRLHRPLMRRVLGYEFRFDLSLLLLTASAFVIVVGVGEPGTVLATWPIVALTILLIYLNVRSGIFVNDQIIRFTGVANRRFLWNDIERIEYSGGRATLVLASGERYVMPGAPQLQWGTTGDVYNQWRPAQRTVAIVTAASPNKIPICFAGPSSEVPPAGVQRCS